MAAVVRNTIVVTKTVEETIPDGVTITLTEGEAKVLRGILGDVVTNDVTSGLFNQLANLYPIKEYKLTVTERVSGFEVSPICVAIEVKPFPAPVEYYVVA